ncbi:unnamed protein product [Discula destructiva]
MHGTCHLDPSVTFYNPNLLMITSQKDHHFTMASSHGADKILWAIFMAFIFAIPATGLFAAIMFLPYKRLWHLLSALTCASFRTTNLGVTALIVMPLRHLWRLITASLRIYVTLLVTLVLAIFLCVSLKQLLILAILTGRYSREVVLPFLFRLSLAVFGGAALCFVVMVCVCGWLDVIDVMVQRLLSWTGYGVLWNPEFLEQEWPPMDEEWRHHANLDIKRKRSGTKKFGTEPEPETPFEPQEVLWENVMEELQHPPQARLAPEQGGSRRPHVQMPSEPEDWVVELGNRVNYW